MKYTVFTNILKINVFLPKKTFFSLLFTLLISIQLTAQVKIGDNTTIIDSSALFEMESLDQGLLISRMDSAQRSAIATPAEGLLVYQTNGSKGFYYYNGSNWTLIGDAMTEVDPVFDTSLAKNITTADTTYWGQDADTANEIQFLSLSNDTIYLTNGSQVKLPANYIIQDADADTKIQTEETADEDKIRFDIAGTERWVMDGSRLEPKNTGGSVFIGEGAGYNDDLTGNNNTFIGYSTGNSNITGYRNTANGYEALSRNTTGHDNTANGNIALYSNTTGHNNTASGYSSLYSNTTGYNNTASGRSALYSNTTGNYNTANGNSALYYNTTGYNNTASGSFALSSNTTGDDNTASGYGALRYNEANSRSTAIGYHAMYNADNRTTGRDTYNTAIGYDALRGSETPADNTGGYNTALGDQTMYSNTTGNFNTAVGQDALYSNTTGSLNTASGRSALSSNTTGDDNTASGSSALRSNTTGNDNTASGSLALRSNTTGNDNTASGYMALYSNTTGSANTVYGFGANYFNQGGSNNVTIGYQAGFGTTAHNKSGNVFIGYKAGFEETLDNKLYIENSDATTPLIYGEFDNDRIGINENAPSANFHIKQVGTGEEGLAIENDTDTDTWAFEIGNNNLILSFNATDVGYWGYSTGSYIATSDKRLKKDIVPFKESVLTKLMRLEVVNYRLRHVAENSQKAFGFIAQDVQTHFPDIVKQREDGYLGLNYDDFGVLAIKAIQEQQEMIREQQEMIQEQQEMIQALDKRIEQLEKK